MGIKDVMKSGFRVKNWFAVDTVKEQTSWLKNLIDTLFNVNKQAKGPQETFVQSIKRYGLTEEELQKRMQEFLRVAGFCLLGGVLLLGYTGYLIVLHQFFASFVALMLAFLSLAYAFRYHFNYFQIKQRRLGCTIKEWVRYSIKRG